MPYFASATFRSSDIFQRNTINHDIAKSKKDIIPNIKWAVSCLKGRAAKNFQLGEERVFQLFKSFVKARRSRNMSHF